MFEITITPPGSVQAFVIYTNAWANAYINGQKRDLVGDVQSTELYGQTAPYLKYRGNDKYQDSFEVQRNVDDNGNLFTDAFAAKWWFDYHCLNIPREGAVDFIFQTHHTQFAYAVVFPKLNKQTGVLLRIQYQIQGINLSVIN